MHNGYYKITWSIQKLISLIVIWFVLSYNSVLLADSVMFSTNLEPSFNTLSTSLSEGVDEILE